MQLTETHRWWTVSSLGVPTANMKIQTLENGCCGRKRWRDNIRMSTQWCEAWLGLSTETLRRGKTMVWVHTSDNFSKTKFCLAAEIGTNPTTVSRCDDGQTTTVWCLYPSPPPPPPHSYLMPLGLVHQISFYPIHRSPLLGEDRLHRCVRLCTTGVCVVTASPVLLLCFPSVCSL